MAFADSLGGVSTFLNMPQGARTATIESKTNFIGSIPVGDTARAECTPLHRGRTTTVCQTRITRGDGKLHTVRVKVANSTYKVRARRGVVR